MIKKKKKKNEKKEKFLQLFKNKIRNLNFIITKNKYIILQLFKKTNK